MVTALFAAVGLSGYSRSTDAGAAVAEEAYVIPPGREANVVEWLQPVATKVAPLKVAGYSIHKSDVRVQLASESVHAASPCSASDWAQPPGALVITRNPPSATPSEGANGETKFGRTVLSSVTCNTTEAVIAPKQAEALTEELDRTYRGDVWTSLEPDRPPVVPGMAEGFADLSPRALSIGTLVLAFILALLVGTFAAFVEPTARQTTVKRSHLAIGFLILLGGLISRGLTAGSMPLDTDESCAMPPSGALQIFTNEHDAVVHPPLARAVFHSWSSFSGWTNESPEWLLRVPSLFAAAVTLLLVTLLVIRAGNSHIRWLPLVMVAFESSVVRTSAMARPYSLACLFVACTIFCTWRPPGGNRIENGLRWGLATVAATLAAWLDVIAGAAAIGAIAIACIQPTFRWHRLVVLGAAGLGLYALAPGLVNAMENGIAPLVPDGMPDLRPSTLGLGNAEFVPALLKLSSFTFFGESSGGLRGAVALLVVLPLAYLALKKQRKHLIWAIAGIVVLAFADTFVVGMRPRNVLFLPFGTAVALGMSADPIMAWLRQRLDAVRALRAERAGR